MKYFYIRFTPKDSNWFCECGTRICEKPFYYYKGQYIVNYLCESCINQKEKNEADWAMGLHGFLPEEIG